MMSSDLIHECDRRNQPLRLVRRRRPDPGIPRRRVPADLRGLGKGDPPGGPRPGHERHRPTLGDGRALLRRVPRPAQGRGRPPLAPHRDAAARKRGPAHAVHRHRHRHQRTPPDRRGPASVREALPDAVRAQPRRRLPLDPRRPHPGLQRVLRANLRIRVARGSPAAGRLGPLPETGGPAGGGRQAPGAPEPDQLRDLPAPQGRQQRLGPREREPHRGTRRARSRSSRAPPSTSPSASGPRSRSSTSPSTTR